MAKHRMRNAKKESFWRSVLRRQASSGMSIRAWCRQEELSEAGFHWWRRELARREACGDRPLTAGSAAARRRRKKYGAKSPRSDARASKAAFVPLRVARDSATSDDGRIEIALADGRCVRVFGTVDRQSLVDVLGILEIPAC